MPNMYSTSALLIAALAILFFFMPIFPLPYNSDFFVISLLLAVVSIVLGIKGFSNFKKNKSIGGETSAVIAIIIGVGYLLFVLVALLLTSPSPSPNMAGDIAKCKLAATVCNNNIASGIFSSHAQCQVTCTAACTDGAGHDVINTSVSVTSATCIRGQANGCAYCTEGNASLINK
jgi:hypothetical protein